MTIMKRDDKAEGDQQLDKLEDTPKVDLDDNFDARAEHAKRGRDLAKGDFAHLVDVLKQMEPGTTGCEALAKGAAHGATYRCEDERRARPGVVQHSGRGDWSLGQE